MGVIIYALFEYIVSDIIYKYFLERVVFMDNLNTLFLIGGLTSLLIFVIAVGLYILFALGLYGLAKNERTGNEWFAFIPILQFYIIGKILKEIKISTYKIPMLELVLPLTPIAVMIAGNILSVVPILGNLLQLLLNLAYAVFSIIVLYNFYKRYRGDKAVIMVVLSVLLFFMGPIYIFNLRKSRPL